MINIKSKYYKYNVSKECQLGDFQNHSWRNKGPQVYINQNKITEKLVSTTCKWKIINTGLASRRYDWFDYNLS